VSEMAVNSVACVKGRDLLLAACEDTTVHMYTLDGSLVGIFGQHSWILDDPLTHQSAAGYQPLPVLDAVGDLYRATQLHRQGPGAAPSVSAVGGWSTNTIVWVLRPHDRFNY
jgi:hypothetical protein